MTEKTPLDKLEFRLQIEELIQNYLKREKNIIQSVRTEWKKDSNYPMYSNQYYAFMELRSFFQDLLKLMRSAKVGKLADKEENGK